MANVVAARETYDFIAFGEPNVSKRTGRNHYTSTDGGATIVNISERYKVTRYRCLSVTVCVETEEFAIYNTYISPNKCTPQEFERHLEDIGQDMRRLTKEKSIIITGDFNAKHPIWGGNVKNKKGEILLDWAYSLNMNILNDGLKPTCIRPNGTSYIDITLVCDKIMWRNPTWKVLEEESMSDHRFTGTKIPSNNKKPNVKYISGKTDSVILRKAFKELTEGKNIDEMECERALTQAYRKSTPKIKSDENLKMPYWWNVQIQNHIAEVKKKRRTFQRCKQAERRMDLQDEYKVMKTSLKK
jgi:hypothetical protein